MLDKTWHFKIGSKDIMIAIPKDTWGRIFTGVFGGLFILDLLTGHMLGAFLMFVFLAYHTVSIR